MEEVNDLWTVVKDERDFRGAYTYQIKWNPPVDSGYIVQKVDVEDPVQLLSGFTQPYYEAWKVDNGKVVYDASDPEDNDDSLYYDDSFSNCCNGWDHAVKIAIETARRKMEEKQIQCCYVKYHCRVFWIQDGTIGADEIKRWKTGEEEGICMAGKLKASYNAPKDLCNGEKREFEVNFKLDADSANDPVIP